MENHDAHTEVHSTLIEPRLMEWVLKPLARRVPSYVAPNQISAVNIVFALLAFVLAAIAPSLEPNAALWSRIGSGLCVWAFLVGDCLDGMHARNTGQTSVFGEFLDHWLDALGAPIAAAGLILTLNLDVYTTIVAVVGAVLVYNCQLVIRHHTGRFIHPPASGVDAQFLLGASLIAAGLALHQFPRSEPAVGVGVTVFAWICVIGTYRNCLFLYERMEKIMLPHLRLVAVLVGLSVPYILGMMSATSYSLLVCFTSFRINGTYVLRSLTRRQYGGMDWAIVAWIVSLLAVNLCFGPTELAYGVRLEDILPYLACLHMVLLNLVEMVDALPTLRGQTVAGKRVVG